MDTISANTQEQNITDMERIKFAHDPANVFRQECDNIIFDILKSKTGNSVSDSLTELYLNLFHSVPHRIELSCDGEYLNKLTDTVYKESLIDKDSECDFIYTANGFVPKDEYFAELKDNLDINKRDLIYTFHNRQILFQSTYYKLITAYTGKHIAAYRVDESPIIIFGDEHPAIFYQRDHFLYALTKEHTLPDYIKNNVVLDEDDEDERFFDYVVYTQHGFDTTELPVKKQDICLEKNYNDDLPHEDIIDFIENGQSGLCILYGNPGTGKTSYIRHIMHICKDTDFMILNTSCFDAINDSSFVNMIIGHKDSVIILEDCEDLMIERNSGGNSRIGTLLNLSDGILGDALRLKFICTFNSKISKIDAAVLRKGRTHVKYEFKPLNSEKAKALAAEIGHTLPAKKSNEGYTLAEIYYSDNELVSGNVSNKVGF